MCRFFLNQQPCRYVRTQADVNRCLCACSRGILLRTDVPDCVLEAYVARVCFSVEEGSVILKSPCQSHGAYFAKAP